MCRACCLWCCFAAFCFWVLCAHSSPFGCCQQAIAVCPCTHLAGASQVLMSQVAQAKMQGRVSSSQARSVKSLGFCWRAQPHQSIMLTTTTGST